VRVHVHADGDGLGKFPPQGKTRQVSNIKMRHMTNVPAKELAYTGADQGLLRNHRLWESLQYVSATRSFELSMYIFRVQRCACETSGTSKACF
jgi:hypothetical protein